MKANYMKNIRNLCILFIISSILLVGCSNGENTDIKKEENTEYSTHSEPHRPALRATYSII